MTQLHMRLLVHRWPSYLTRDQCLRIVGVFQLGAEALEREIRLGASHDTEATLMLLASVASRRATLGNSGKEEALQQISRMAIKMGFSLPDWGASDAVMYS